MCYVHARFEKDYNDFNRRADDFTRIRNRRLCMRSQHTIHLTRVSIPFLILIALIISLASCSSSSSGTKTDTVDAVSKATAARYRTGEVREYQGKLLEPAIGPRDNSISGVQSVDIETYLLTIDGLVNEPTVMTYDEVLALTPYERLITLYCVEGWEATILWKGVRLADLFDKAGVQSDAVTVIFHAADGYTTSLPLDTVLSRDLILAYKSNGLDLPPEMGYPFIVVAEDKLGYKWARWVTRIELSSDADYLGYWEQYGYSNKADVDK
jgi:DMSO/TMAO reductase YedYZ molybdopterin-dependent catalytic subunit